MAYKCFYTQSLITEYNSLIWNGLADLLGEYLLSLV